MDFKDYPVSNNDLDRRIDKIIRIFAPEMALSQVYKAIRKGLIRVNNQKIKENYKTLQGDVINIAAFLIENNPAPQTAPTTPIPRPALDIIFQNEHLLIINKPYDILVHGSDNSLDKQVESYYKQNYKNDSLSFTPGPLHRLDRKTTGLLTFSLSLQGARWFSENIKTHSIKKTYAAIITGKLIREEHWEDYIQKDEASKGFKTVKANTKASDSENEKLASTTITPIAYGKYKNKDVTLVKLDIHTGRTHQIRAQSSLHNHPLLGDTAYNGTKTAEFKQDFFLQAYQLDFPENPVGLPDSIKIRLNPEFIKALKHCEIENYSL